MPITKTTGYKASDGMVYASVEEAQFAELEALFNGTNEHLSKVVEPRDVAGFVMREKDKILDILTTGPRSRPKARKQAGTTAPKRATKAAKRDVVQSISGSEGAQVASGDGISQARKAVVDKFNATAAEARTNMEAKLASKEQAEAGFAGMREAVEGATT